MILAVIKYIFTWLTSGPLDRILRSIDNNVDNTTRREEIKADAIARVTESQVKVLTGPGWWFPLFFVIPAGLWFAAVCIYSVFWCRGCVFPQTWSIAALPPPLDQWMGVIISGLFIGGIVQYWRAK